MTSSESGADDTSASTATLPPYRQKMVDEQLDEYADVDNDDDADVQVEFTATTAEDDVSSVSQPVDDTHVPTSAMEIDAGASSDVAADGEEGDDADTCDLKLPEDFSVFLEWTEFEHVLPLDDSRGLVGDWTTLMYRKFHEVYPTCALRFLYNYCRKINSRKDDFAVLDRQGIM